MTKSSRNNFRIQQQDFVGGHPSQYYSGTKALNFPVVIGPLGITYEWLLFVEVAKIGRYCKVSF